MSSFLTLDRVAARTPEQALLFQDLTLSLGSERVGLVGRNGSGKSTLLAIAAGRLEPASGTVRRSGTAGLLQQDWPADWTLGKALGIADALATLARILRDDGSPADLDTADWTLEARVDAALSETGLGPHLDSHPLERRMGTLSGGERTRVAIARLRLEAPDLLLLDEPTNNLDAAGRAAIQTLLRSWRGGVLVASHDRDLLEGADRIVELTPVGVRIVGGGWSAFAASREADRTRASAELERAGATLREAERAAQHRREAKDRRDKAGRAFAAKGSEPKILLDARAERAEASGGRGRAVGERLVAEAAARAEAARSHVAVVTPLSIDLPPSGLPSGARVLAMDAAASVRDGRPLGPWTLRIDGPERIALRGPNGAGKTTLLHLAAGLLRPDRGRVRRAEGRVALLDQHVGLLDPQASVLDNLRRTNPALDDEAAHALAARFAFRNRDARQVAGTLSGGERLRAGLACTLAGPRPPWLLVLDEPTNHLDIESVELLETALRAFDGALLVASHDERFLAAIGLERTFDVTPRPRS